MTDTQEQYSAGDVIEAFDFLLKYPTPFAFDVEDSDEIETLHQRWIHSMNIRHWYSTNGNDWLAEYRRTLKGVK